MSEDQIDVNESEGSSVQDLIGKYLPYWPIFAVLIALGSLVAYLKLRKATPIYEAHAAILIKEEDQTGQDLILRQLNGPNNSKNILNEVILLKSHPIAQDVVRNLHLYAPIMEIGRVREMSAYTSSPVVFVVPNPDSLVEVSHVYFIWNAGSQTVTIGDRAYPLNQFVNTPYGVIKMLPNKHYTGAPVVNPVYFSLVSIPNMAGAVQGGLGVAGDSKGSSLVNLSYNDESPERAVDILNELVNVYSKSTINEKNQLASNTLKFLEERIRYAEDDLDSVERKLENFRATNRIIDLSSQGQQYLGNVNTNDQRITDLNIQLSVLDQVQNYITSKQQNKEALVPAGIADPILSSQLQQLYTSETQQAQLRATMGENYPALSSVTAEIGKIRSTLLENLQNQRKNIVATRNDLYGVNNRFNSLLSSLPAQERALINISRQQQIKNTIYTFLLQKREETMLSFASTVSDSRLVNHAQAGGIISPVSKNMYLQWIFIGVIAGVIFIFIRENLNRNIIARSEVEKMTVTPVIADIAHSKEADTIVVQSGNRSLIAEQFRYLRTSLNYIGINASHKKILFTSSISGEGKSFITTNLGATLALTGKKVIMLELDLRKPKLSEMLGLDRNTGMSDYFIDNKTLSEVIKTTPIANLFLISSGAIPPNPSELLMNGRLQELLVLLEASYDYILIDTAPVSPVTDAYIISPMCDATLYVVRQGVTPRVLIKKLNDILRSKRLKNISIVFNGVKHKKFGSYYGYGYTYGYGYLDEKSKKGKKKTTTS